MAYSAEKLKALLEHRGIKTAWLIKQTGLSRRTFSYVFSGQRFTPEVAERCAAALGIPVSLLEDTDVH